MRDKVLSGEVVLRVLIAAFGGYGLAYASTAFLSVYLPMARAERVITATLLCFAVACVVVIWSFAARNAWRTAAILAMTSIALALTAFLPGDFGGRP